MNLKIFEDSFELTFEQTMNIMYGSDWRREKFRFFESLWEVIFDCDSRKSRAIRRYWMRLYCRYLSRERVANLVLPERARKREEGANPSGFWRRLHRISLYPEKFRLLFECYSTVVEHHFCRWRSIESFQSQGKRGVHTKSILMCERQF